MKNLSKIIKFLYLFIFFLTPFLFTFSNSELFEIPKMYFIYLITLTITFIHLINWIVGNVPFSKKNFLNLFLLVFLISQIVCTITSIDVHTSFFGYYSRLNGGLLSTICYFLLYIFLLPYLDKKQKTDIINISLLSGFIVSIYGILEHFGIDKNLWVQDVQSRVFSTLGQPNWLAAYIAILLPLSLYKYFESRTVNYQTPNKMYGRIIIHPYKYLFLITTFYITLLFTKSKSGILASIISIAIFFLFMIIRDIKKKVLSLNLKSYIIYLVFLVLSLTITNPIKDFIFTNNLEIKN